MLCIALMVVCKILRVCSQYPCAKYRRFKEILDICFSSYLTKLAKKVNIPYQDIIDTPNPI